ncbi:hypothetical protein [Egicoccus sp. AB-alg2]|uniref:hypothetical protein n=1 Tax=Egicoccus sp. AB-alg2 TaxID=3242693 RepID=UPI00359E01BD
MRRALLWLGAGVLALVVLVLVTAPELVGADLSGVAGLLGIVLLAGVPGVLLIGWLAARRARRGDHTTPDPGGNGALRRRT